MKIALLGYGNMGKAIEGIAHSQGDEIVLKLDSKTQPGWENELLKADVAIEFSSPELVANHVEVCFRNNIPVVIGTTAWYQYFDEISRRCLEQQQSMFYATNFSIGVNLFFEVNKFLASLMNHHSDYRASMEEVHHIRKKDAPSGTAITLAEQLMVNHAHYDSWKNEAGQDAGVLPIVSIRENDVPGTHTIRYTSEIDQLEITHTAFNRTGFASGALLAAAFIIGKKGIFTMTDLLNLKPSYGN
jgi:4-hydroxy-tetrahydrodipicolinate reductase